MKVLKWLDEHFEETMLIILLVLISCVELLQVVCRNVPWIPALTWPEEFCRFLWIATVFISIPYTIRTCTALRVTALIDLLPWKVHNIADIVIDVFNAVMLGILAYVSVTVFGNILAGGTTSPAMAIPMWTIYAFVVFGFFFGTFRALQMVFIHIKNINVPPVNSVEEAAAFELEAEKHNAEGAGYAGAAANDEGRN